MNFSLSISTPRDFNFWRTVYSHGWCSLPPFFVDKERRTLRRPFTLSRDLIAFCSLTAKNSTIVVHAESNRLPTPAQRKELRGKILECFRLDENFVEFYSEARRHRQYRWIPRMRVGRLLRAPTVFEDVVKMMCTTNCSWALTQAMVGNLSAKLGKPVNSSGFDFPLPEAIAGVTESFLRKEIKSGYRSPFLLEFAQNVASGKVDVESWRTTTSPTGELYDKLLSVKGIGPYAAGNIMKLLGRYDYLGIDSWVRKQFSDLHKNGRKASDTSIEKYYRPYGKWKGLFFWLEMTRSWYKEKFPF